jgi:MFS transporter, FSR family, fosmidomycin resistance protein
MTVTVSPPISSRRTLTVCGGAHALHDGFTDLLNVLYPLLQAQFGLSYAAIGALKTVYSGAMASGQIPSGKLAVRLGGVRVLATGTLLIAVGYGLAGLTGSLYVWSLNRLSSARPSLLIGGLPLILAWGRCQL